MIFRPESFSSFTLDPFYVLFGELGSAKYKILLDGEKSDVLKTSNCKKGFVFDPTELWL